MQKYSMWYSESGECQLVESAHGSYCLASDVAALERESLEQSRLLGMSGEREARYLARIAELEKRDGIDFLFLWMTTPNPMLGNTKPIEIMKLGRGQKLAQFIEQAMEDEAEAQKARS